jgi:small subunit ribosomal protein S2
VVDYPVPGNDDAIRAVGLLTRVIADAVADGLVTRAGAAAAASEGEASAEPLPEWEREQLAATQTAVVEEALEEKVGEQIDAAVAAEAQAAATADQPAEAATSGENTEETTA